MAASAAAIAALLTAWVLFSKPDLTMALICDWAFFTMLGVFLALKAVGVLRVSAEEEQTGLNISEHGMHAYPSDVVSGGAIA